MNHGPLADSVRLIIFDLDGTLIDSKYDIAASVNLTLGDLDLPDVASRTNLYLRG